ncbi:MAG: hypothetical protein HY514_01760, partial [Candidatus Aenigmarchaeota archaeon]|nr:hypothetical protein [Candidatus Aenigmarchaeota archaeon]
MAKITTEERVANIKSRSNRAAVKKFVSYLQSEGRTEARIQKYCWMLSN